MNELSRRCLFRVAMAIVLCGTWACLQADAGEDKRVAISGYDPVAYFTDGHPVKGSSAFSSTFDDVKLEADPEAWAISDDRLYVFHNRQGTADRKGLRRLYCQG
jgi:hypothetical protein